MSFLSANPEHDFDFDDSTVFEYTHGNCWYLALALQQKTGLPIVCVWGDDLMQHVGVELPNGDVVDIMGVWTSSAWGSYWYDELDDCDEVYCGEISDDDPNWHNATLTYSNDMLNEILDCGMTLGENADLIIDVLHLKGLMAQPAA